MLIDIGFKIFLEITFYGIVTLINLLGYLKKLLIFFNLFRFFIYLSIECSYCIWTKDFNVIAGR